MPSNDGIFFLQDNTRSSDGGELFNYNRFKMDTVNPSNLWEAVFITGISEEMRSIVVENNSKPTEEECLNLADSLGKLEKHRIPYYVIRVYPLRIYKMS